MGNLRLQGFKGRKLWQLLSKLFQWNDRKIVAGHEVSLIDNLESAQREWKHAKLYFNNVTDPDLIDHAIFYMDASEKKYIYLLKRARETGMNIEKFSFNTTD